MRKLKKLKIEKKLLKNWLMVIVAVGLIMFGLLIAWVSTLQIPDFKSFTDRKIQSSTKIYDRTGKIVLYDVHQDIKRTVIPYEEMGVNIKNATVAIEDSEFYNHKGIRITSIIRATVWAKLTGRKIQGGSTITQQLVKNTLLTSNRSISRKIKEWILSVKIEKIMSKDEILALYLNEAPYGGSIYGIEEASRAFFGKEPANLTMAESAYLAAIPNGPTYYSPYRKNKDKLDERKNLVLKRMLDVSFITEEEYNKAKSEVVTFLPEKPTNIAAPHFVFFIKEYLEKKYGVDALEAGGLEVTTTIDYELQKKAERIVMEKAKLNEAEWGGKNAAAVVIDPKTGQILAMVGSRDYFDKSIDGNFNVVTAERQPGSSFKPIVYALAFQKGYTKDTVLFDVKTEFNASCNPSATGSKTENGNSCYSPDNYDNSFRGPMTLKNGLAQSINIIAVKLLYLVGVNNSIKFAHDLGITTLNDPSRYGLSLVIGGGETTLLDMTSVYSVFANSGVRNPYQGVLSIKDNSGNILEEYKPNPYKVLEPEITYSLSEILSDNSARTPTFGANSPLVIPGREVAVKTGTTNNNKDAWTIGYTPSVAVGVWVGNNDNVPMKKGGAALAGPIWNGIMTEALKNIPIENFEKPTPINKSLPAIIRGFWMGGETFKTDSVSNKLATDLTPEETTEEFSITNVHTILYWIDKENPLVYKKVLGGGDSQYNNWEYGVSNWWLLNKYKYRTITNLDKPSSYDNIHTENTKPVFEISGIKTTDYKKDENVNYSILTKSLNGIKKIDIFVNKTYITSLKSPTTPINSSFMLSSVSDLESKNSLRIIGTDNIGNKGENSVDFYVDMN